MEYQSIKHECAYYLGLSELVETRLAQSANYHYAVTALSECWKWLEGESVMPKELLDSFHDDDDFGVEPSMIIESDHERWNVWACVAVGIVITASIAYRQAGALQLPENLVGADSSQNQQQFMRCFNSLIPVESVTERFRVLLDGLGSSEVTRAQVRDCAFRALHEAALSVAVKA